MLSIEKVQQKLALATTSSLSPIERLATFGPTVLLYGEGAAMVAVGESSSSQHEIVEATLRSLFATHFTTRSKVRWECKGAYALALADVLCAEGAIDRHPEDFRSMLALGADSSLLALLSYGCSSQSRGDATKLAMVNLAQWTEELVSADHLPNFADWIDSGIQIVTDEVESMVQNASARLSREVQQLMEVAVDETWLQLISAVDATSGGLAPYAQMTTADTARLEMSASGAPLARKRLVTLLEATSTALLKLRRGMNAMRQLVTTPLQLLAMASKFLRLLAHLEPGEVLLGVMQRANQAASTLELQLKQYVVDFTIPIPPAEGEQATSELSSKVLEESTLGNLRVKPHRKLKP